MRPIRYSINVTLDGCCDHREGIVDEDLHRHAAENLAQADALLFGRVTYEMMEAAWRPPARTGVRPDWMEPWMEPFARTIDAAGRVASARHFQPLPRRALQAPLGTGGPGLPLPRPGSQCRIARFPSLR